VIGPQIQNDIATRPPSLPSEAPRGNVSSNGTSPSFATQLGEALGGRPGPSAGAGTKDVKRPVKAGTDSGPSDVPVVASPAYAGARPSASQAPLAASAKRTDEAAASDQPPDQSHEVQPLAVDSRSASTAKGSEANRVPGAPGPQPESESATGRDASPHVDDQTIGQQNDPADSLSESQPANPTVDNAESFPYAGPSDTSNLTQTELGPAVLQQEEEAAPESASSCTQLEDCETGVTTSKQNSVGLTVGAPNGTNVAGPQSLGADLTSLSAVQAFSGNDGFGSQPGTSQTGQHSGPSLSEGAKEATGNEVISGTQANSDFVKPEPQLQSPLPAAMIDPPMVRAEPSPPSPSPTTSQGVHEGMLGAWEGHLQDGTQIVKAAELTARLGSVEVRVELRTENLGSMELRAMMHEDRLGAAIGVGTLDAKTALATELPGLQRALMERNVQLDSISIFSGSSGGATGHESGYRSPSGNSPHSAGEVAYYPSLQWEEPSLTPGSEVWHPGDRWVRLSVRA
jgi:flagellar hook-length control protein FliK